MVLPMTKTMASDSFQRSSLSNAQADEGTGGRALSVGQALRL